MKKKSIACLLSLVTVVVLVLINGFSSDAASGKWQQTNGRWWYQYSDGGYAQSEYIDGYWLDGAGWYDSTWNGHWVSNDTGWWFESGSWYPTNQWLKIDTKWYHFNGSGYMDANKWIGNYYVQGDGSMATSKWIGDYYVGSDGAWIPNKTKDDSSGNNNNNNQQSTTEAPKVECSKSPNGKHNWQDWYEPKKYYVGVKCHCQHCGYEWIDGSQPAGWTHICADGAVSNFTCWDEYETRMEYAYTYCTYCNKHK
ncbi:MAG: hypothetical protein K6E10_06385 [Eubacterium sp.]|nr:hypothetical protein [Eubacterium sp.]